MAAVVNVPRQRRNTTPTARDLVGVLGVGGQLRTGHRNGRVWVNAFIGAGVTADVTPEEAEAFAYALLEHARHARRTR